MQQVNENIFKTVIDSEYVEDFKLNFFNSVNKHGYTGYICSVFIAREDWQESGLVLSVKFVKFSDIEEFLQVHELLPGTKLSEKIFIKRG
jgi:hypothetical protein